jgi:hypothetical protein
MSTKACPNEALISWAEEWAKEGKRRWIGRGFYHLGKFRSYRAAGWGSALSPGSITTEG